MNVREDLLTDLVATLYKDNARIKQLEAEITILQVDAERYRWLRQQSNREEGARLLIHKMNVDAAIDTARGAA